MARNFLHIMSESCFDDDTVSAAAKERVAKLTRFEEPLDGLSCAATDQSEVVTSDHRALWRVADLSTSCRFSKRLQDGSLQ